MTTVGPTVSGRQTAALLGLGTGATIALNFASDYAGEAVAYVKDSAPNLLEWFGDQPAYYHTDDDDMGDVVVITPEGRFGKRAKGRLGQKVPTTSEIEGHEDYWARYERHKQYMQSHGGKRRKSTADEGRSSDLRIVKTEPEDRADTDFISIFRGTDDEHPDEHGSSRSGRTIISSALFLRGTHCNKWFDIVTTDTINLSTFVFTSSTILTWTSDITAGSTRFTKYPCALLPKDTATTSSRYREGDCAKIGGIELEGSAWTTTGTSNPSFIRVMIIQTRLGGHNNTDFASDVIDKNICNIGSTKLGVWEPIAMDNKYNYNVLKDKVYKCKPTVATTFNPKDIKITMKFKKPLEIIYGPDTWTTSGTTQWNEVKSNGLAVLVAGCAYDGSSLSHTATFRMRLHFEDGVV
jgi:hypothetical protein